MTSLQRSYGDRISVVGICSDPIDVLKKFIDEHNDEMGYAVGHTSKEVMSKYLEGVSSVPFSFIIDKKGDVAWKGHPEKIEEVLDKILSGANDNKLFKKIEAMEKTLNEEIENKDMTSIAKAARSLLDIDPANILSLQVVIIYAKYIEDPKLIREIFDDIPITDLSGYKANKIAVMLFTDSDLAYRHPDIALKFSTYALNQGPENGNYINTYAGLLYCIGDVEKAIVWQKKAIKIVPDNNSYQDNLNYYLSIKRIMDDSKDDNPNRHQD